MLSINVYLDKLDHPSISETMKPAVVGKMLADTLSAEMMASIADIRMFADSLPALGGDHESLIRAYSNLINQSEFIIKRSKEYISYLESLEDSGS